MGVPLMVFTDYQEAQAAAEAGDQRLVAFGQRQGTTMVTAGYVLVAPEATDAEITSAVFEAKHGRPIDDRERLLDSIAQEIASAED